MGNVMSLKKLHNKVSRNGFDLQRKNSFSAKVGELLPCTVVECLPGDSHKVRVQNFSRTMPVNTPAFTRIREYFDWFFVPTNLLWNRYNTFVTQMVQNNQKADSITSSSILTDRHPYFTSDAVKSYISKLNAQPNNLFGFNRADLSMKLLNYLDYGRWSRDKSNSNTIVGPSENVVLNPFPLLAYQKIYADYFRNSQWEKPNAPSFNIDYMKGDANNLQIPIASLDATKSYTMFDLRYCNWNKDYFMGVLPSSQYGDAVFVGSGEPIKQFMSQANSVQGDRIVLDAYEMKKLANSLGLSDSSSQEQINGFFSILQLRQYEAKQKWAEITQSQQQDAKSQIEAHFGVTISDAYSDRCRYVGGSVNTIDISEVVNTNLSSKDLQADLAGKGVGAGESFVDFKTDVHGYLMCIYHAVPLLDYSITGIPKCNLKHRVTDYAIPEFDRTGMVQVPLVELSSTYDSSELKSSLLGYAPRYYDYKTSYDRVHGAFVDGGLDAWVAPFDDSYIDKYLKSSLVPGENEGINYIFFKVNPATLNPIFMAAVDSTTATDQILINANFDVKSVRNLDYDGLPY